MAFYEDWVTVNDLAVVDEDGFITICGRSKDMIVSGGLNIYPSEIEAVIEHIDGVLEVAVVGIPDQEWGERLHAFIVEDATLTITDSAILEVCRTELSSHKVPKGVSRIEKLPKNLSGKILKKELRKFFIKAA